MRGAFGWAVGGRCAVTGKMRYGPSMAAKKVRQMALTDAEAHLLTSYRCEHCSWWHVGHDRRPRAVSA